MIGRLFPPRGLFENLSKPVFSLLLVGIFLLNQSYPVFAIDVPNGNQIGAGISAPLGGEDAETVQCENICDQPGLEGQLLTQCAAFATLDDKAAIKAGKIPPIITNQTFAAADAVTAGLCLAACAVLFTPAAPTYAQLSPPCDAMSMVVGTAEAVEQIVQTAETGKAGSPGAILSDVLLGAGIATGLAGMAGCMGEMTSMGIGIGTMAAGAGAGAAIQQK